MAQYEYLDHTADIAIRARGESAAAALGALVEGVLALLNEGNPVAAREERRVSACGDAPDECIVNFVNEILFQIEGERWVPCRARDIAYAPDRIEAVLLGEPFDPERHVIATEIKAATYHQFRLREQAGACEIQVVFDV